MWALVEEVIGTVDERLLITILPGRTAKAKFKLLNVGVHHCAGKKRSFNGQSCSPLTPRRTTHIHGKMAECKSRTPPEIKQRIGSCCVLASSLRTDSCFLVSLRSKFLCNCLLEFLSIYAVAFGGVHKNVVAAGGRSLIS